MSAYTVELVLVAVVAEVDVGEARTGGGLSSPALRKRLTTAVTSTTAIVAASPRTAGSYRRSGHAGTSSRSPAREPPVERFVASLAPPDDDPLGLPQGDHVRHLPFKAHRGPRVQEDGATKSRQICHLPLPFRVLHVNAIRPEFGKPLRRIAEGDEGHERSAAPPPSGGKGVCNREYDRVAEAAAQDLSRRATQSMKRHPRNPEQNRAQALWGSTTAQRALGRDQGDLSLRGLYGNPDGGGTTGT